MFQASPKFDQTKSVETEQLTAQMARNGLSFREIGNAELMKLGYDAERCACSTLGIFKEGLSAPLSFLATEPDRISSARDNLRLSASNLVRAFDNWKELVPELRDNNEIPLHVKQVLAVIAANSGSANKVDQAAELRAILAIGQSLIPFADNAEVTGLGQRLFRQATASGNVDSALALDKAFKINPTFSTPLLEEASLWSLRKGTSISFSDWLTPEFKNGAEYHSAIVEGLRHNIEFGNFSEISGLMENGKPFSPAENRELSELFLKKVSERLDVVAAGPKVGQDDLWSKQLDDIIHQALVIQAVKFPEIQNPLRAKLSETINEFSKNGLDRSHPGEFKELVDAGSRAGIKKGR